MKVLGIESSCDETACAIVEDGKKILSNVVATQIPFHEIYRGVVPEIASRKHAEWILPVVRQAVSEAGLTFDDIDAIAATNRPGLMGSLLVGLTFGKTLAWSLNKPFYAVNYDRKYHNSVKPHGIHGLYKGIGAKSVGAGENNRSKAVIALALA